MYASRITFLICFGILLCWAGPAAGAILNFGSWDGALEVLWDRASLETDPDGDTTNAFEIRNTRTEERVTFRNTEGFLVDPRLATFSLGGTFGLGQEDHTSVVMGAGTNEERRADLSGFDLLATILPRNATLSAEMFANRNKNIQTREFAGRTDIEVEQRGAMLRAMRLYIPSSLSVRRERFASVARIGTSEVKTDERRDVVNYEGQRGWLNKEMLFRYESVDKTDSVRPSLDYRTRDAILSSLVDFGPDLNRHWRSLLRVNSRDGFSAEDRQQIDQLLQISHGPRLRTSYRYLLDRIERSGGKTTSQDATFSLSHQLYESLTTEVGLNARDQTFVDGQLENYGGNLRLRYTKKLPRSGRFNASFSAARQREDDDFDEAFVPQEQLTFDAAFAIPMFLANANVILLSVEVTKTANGPPVAGCAAFSTPTALVEGVDYLLRTVGTRTEIVPQLCSATSPGINPGDTIAVDYRFTRGGEPVNFTTSLNRYHVSIDYGWIRPFFDMERTDQDIVSGMDSGFLTDRRTSTIGLELRGKWQRLQANLQIASEDFDSDDQVFDRDRANGQLRYTLSPRLSLALSGMLSTTSHSFPEPRESDFVLLRAVLTYRRNGNFFASLFARKQEIEDTRVLDQRTEELGIRTRWRIGKLAVNGTISVLDVQRGTSDTRDYRMMLDVKRRFSWR